MQLWSCEMGVSDKGLDQNLILCFFRKHCKVLYDLTESIQGMEEVREKIENECRMGLELKCIKVYAAAQPGAASDHFHFHSILQ